MMKRFAFLFIISLLFSNHVFSQKADRIAKVPILKYESSFGLGFNTDGWGFGYRLGKSKTFTHKKTWDFAFNFVRDSKQIRTDNGYDNTAKSYFYGKQIYFYNLQILRGSQKTITQKPYWGGVELRYFYFGGLNIGFGKPIYLYVEDYLNGGIIVLERFDINKHEPDIIWGRGPYSKGMSEIEVHPGLSFKLGLNAEFGPYQEKSKAFEAGFVLDTYAIPVQIMALNEPSYFMIRLYLSYRFGSRYDSFH
jgi:hypothetical protein